jgi:ABC-three component (ABC-3C) system Middle Component 6
MILPSKHITENQTLLAVGAVLLRHLDRPHTVTSLWDQVRHDRAVGTYERFILALDLLHITGVVRLSQGLIEREAA